MRRLWVVEEWNGKKWVLADGDIDRIVADNREHADWVDKDYHSQGRRTRVVEYVPRRKG